MFAYLCIQEYLCLKLEYFGLWAPNSSLGKIHDKNVASKGPQRLLNRFEISEKGHQTDSNGPIPISFPIEKLNPFKKKNCVSQKRNKVVGQRSLPQTMFADDGNESLYVSSCKLSACGAPYST